MSFCEQEMAFMLTNRRSETFCNQNFPFAGPGLPKGQGIIVPQPNIVMFGNYTKIIPPRKTQVDFHIVQVNLQFGGIKVGAHHFSQMYPLFPHHLFQCCFKAYSAECKPNQLHAGKKENKKCHSWRMRRKYVKYNGFVCSL